MYALSLDKDSRILSATLSKYAFQDAIQVDTLPTGDLADYKYINNEFIYDPLPKEPEAKDQIDILQEKIDSLESQNNILLECLLEMSEIVYN